MNQQERIAAVRSMHKPEHQADQMVYEVWEDGEVTLTKGGELYGMRGLHCISMGCSDGALPADSLVVKNSQHSRIVVGSKEEADAAAKIILMH